MAELIEFLISSVGLTKQQMTFLTRTFWVVFVSFHILWVCGWLTVFGLAPPFASAVESSQIIQDIKDERIERLDRDILTIRTSQCQATDPKAKAQYTERLQELINKYWQVAQRAPRVPGCDEV
jgi:hypothetical protein